ncbi:MAG: hypothetical protein ABEI39_03375 [Halobacteriales archaeon]
MAPTVHDLRNEIRAAAGRFERAVSTAFTKEDLAAIHAAAGADAETEGRLPPTAEMRAGILRAIGHADPGELDRPFRKAELEAIADALED